VTTHRGLRIREPMLLVAGLGVVFAFAPRLARADLQPGACGLTSIDASSAVVIKSCLVPGFDRAVDVAIDGNTMYVARGWDSAYPEDQQLVRAYNISNVESPTLLTSLWGDQSDVYAVAAGGVSAGNGMVFAANDCEAACSQNVRVTAYNQCDAWSEDLLLNQHTLNDRGMHTVFYDGSGGYLYGANNRQTDDDFYVPFWAIQSCPVADVFSNGAIAVDLEAGQSHIHEVAGANGRLAVAAWTDTVLFDVSDGPQNAGSPIARTTAGTAMHSAWPFASNKVLVTEERSGGRLLAFFHESQNPTLVPKGAHKIPSTKTCSYHEVEYVDTQAYASAYQAGLRAWRWIPDDGDLALSAYFDTSNASAPTSCGTDPSAWVGAWGVTFGPKVNQRRIVAISNVPSGGFDQRVFLLSVYAPDPGCTDISCTEATPIPAGNAPYQDALLAFGSDDGTTQTGKLVRYPGSASGPGTPVTILQGGLTAGHDYGDEIAVGDFDGDGLKDVAVGAPGQSVGGVDAGVVYVYRRSSAGSYTLLQTLSQAGLGVNASGERFGSALAAGDFNYDGIDDLAVGAPAATEASGKAAGAVFLFRGTASGLQPSTTLTHTSNAREGDRYGHALAAGDFNGDGPDDLAIGAPQGRTSATGPHAGFFDVYKGVAGGIPTFAKRMTQRGLDTDETEDRLGFALAAGDWNNDGRDDLVVGAPGEHIGDVSSGRVYAYLGSFTSTLVTWHALDQSVLDVNEEEDMFGRRLAAGDFNGDGHDDVAISAPGEHPGNAPRAGRVYVYRGTTSSLQPQTRVDQAVLQTHDDLDGFGERLAAGDLNGDGKAELLVSAPGLFGQAEVTNPLYLYGGTAAGPTNWQTMAIP
jgi:hypothetical protein